MSIPLKMTFSASSYNDLDDDGWQDMPVIRPSHDTSTALALDDEDKKRYHYRPEREPPLASDSPTIGTSLGNATGKLVDVDARGTEWREKEKLDEMDYTRLELDDDPEEDEVSMRTQYLFNEDKGMTPLSQMQATKTLLTEGQRIAYVGLCRLVARELVQTLAMAARGAKELEPAAESARNWQAKIMGRLYRHMEVDGPEQRMIEQLAEHGVTAEDLVPALVVTHEVDNPEYDPQAAREQEEELARQKEDEERQVEQQRILEQARAEQEQLWTVSDNVKPEAETEETDAEKVEAERVAAEEKEKSRVALEVARIERRESLAREEAEGIASPKMGYSPRRRTSKSSLSSMTSPSLGSLAAQQADLGGDIGGALGATPTSPRRKPSLANLTLRESLTEATPDSNPATPPPAPKSPALAVEPPTPGPGPAPAQTPEPKTPTHQTENFLSPLPSALPGVSTTLTAADKTITLDIRWTVLCDLFLSLIADSVYDARSRVLLGMIADRLGLDWMDVVRFERRLTEALEIQEGVKEKEHGEVLADREKKGKKARYVMMGLATLGGGLVIGLSAGLLAPVIGAGLGAALTTVGVGGTTTFLAGAGGSAIIASGATVTGSYIGGKAMGRRTRHVKTFDFQPIHNNKRVNCYITIPGFMSGPLDDVRLPYSTIDPVMGDVFSVLWEPDMMGETGNALKILSSEVLTQAGQQVLAATLAGALFAALQWPMMLTKLSYLIDNPWSNALDRAKQAGAVLADILINRRLGVRPVSLVGFSLGARVIFYALVELAKHNAFGVVQEVFFFGATVTASKKVWRQVRGVVSGRFVNAFAMNDWVLGYLFRATSGGLNTVAGLRPVEHVPDLENIDVTHLLNGHMSYRSLMPVLLTYVGFKTTADHFDEPEEMEMDEGVEREVVTPEEEERRRLKKERGKLLGIFSRKKASSSAPMSRTVSGEYDSPEPGSVSGSRHGSAESLPDRLAVAGGGARLRSASSLSVSSTKPPSEEAHSDDEHDEHDHAGANGNSDSQAEPTSARAKKSTLATPAVAPPTPPTPEVESVGFDLSKLRSEVAALPKPPVHEDDDDEDHTQELAPPPPTGSAPHTADLRNLDGELDPRELLRRQWAGEAVPATSLAPAAEVEEGGFGGGWGAQSGGGFNFPTAPPPAPTSFTFGDANGGFEGSWGGKSRDEDEEEVGGGAGGGFGWGAKGAMESKASLADNNPW